MRGDRIIVHGDDFISGGPRHQLKWLEEVVDKHVESKHTVKRASSDLAKPLVMLNRNRVVGQRDRVYPGQKNTDRVVEALNLQHRKTVVTPAVRESQNADGESTRECSWESMRDPDCRSEEAPTHDVMDAEKTSLCRSAVARLNNWAVDRPDIQYAVRVAETQTCGKIRVGMSRHRDHAGNIRSRLEQSPDRYRDELWGSRAVRRGRNRLWPKLRF